MKSETQSEINDFKELCITVGEAVSYLDVWLPNLQKVCAGSIQNIELKRAVVDEPLKKSEKRKMAKNHEVIALLFHKKKPTYLITPRGLKKLFEIYNGDKKALKPYFEKLEEQVKSLEEKIKSFSQAFE